jgi:uncharacterized membrane protein YgdD (TMEM256/DUF423 family)
VSIAAMSDAKLMRERPEQRSAKGFERAIGLQALVERRQTTEKETPKPSIVPPTVVGQLTRWIPTETITLYVAFLALLNPLTATEGEQLCDAANYTGRWVAVGAFALLTVALVVLLHVTKVRRTKEPFRWPAWEMIVSLVAFVGWAVALPETPLHVICGYNEEIGGFVVLVLTLFIAAVADALGRNIEPASS